MISDKMVHAELERLGVDPYNEYFDEAFESVKEELEAGIVKDMTARLTTAMQGSKGDLTKVLDKLLGDWDFEDDFFEGPISKCGLEIYYKNYTINYDSIWLFSDDTKEMLFRDESLLSGLQTCDKFREQGL